MCSAPGIAEPLDFSVPALGDFGWLVFTSVNGVDAFFDRGLERRFDAALAGRQRRGDRPRHRGAPGRGITRRLVPERFVAESLLEAFPPPWQPGTVLLPVPSCATCCPRSVLRGYAVDVLPVYRTVRAEPDADALARVRRRRRRPHVHVVVDGRQLLRSPREGARPAARRRVDRPRDLRHRPRPRPPRRRRSRRPHHRRRRRHGPSHARWF